MVCVSTPVCTAGCMHVYTDGRTYARKDVRIASHKGIFVRCLLYIRRYGRASGAFIPLILILEGAQMTPRKIAVGSKKGGPGKTTVTCRLAEAFQRNGD